METGMKFRIQHEIRGRIRVHMICGSMTYAQADTLLYYLNGLDGVTGAKVYERTKDAVICYAGSRNALLHALQVFRYETAKAPKEYPEGSGRRLNAEYQERLIGRILLRILKRLFLPYTVRCALTALQSVKYLYRGLYTLTKRRIEVPVLDAAAIGVSVLRRDFNTAGSVMFLLGIGEILEEWTHKKSVGDLAGALSLNVGKVWVIRNGCEVQEDASGIAQGDLVVVRMGTVVPFDGIVTAGEGQVNQSSLTGEGLPVFKEKGGYVYAGSVLEEGELTIEVQKGSKTSRYEKIAAMIEESEKLKSKLESRAEHLADRLVPCALLGTVLAWALTRNVNRALSFLMVDFSCALKLAMPISVLSAIKEARQKGITVKGGKYLEAVSSAATIVFDKTGTLTKARPRVAEVVVFGEESPDEMLRIAACLEEHFPHSMARAVVRAAEEKNLEHREMHSHVEYIVAHGIASSIEGKKVIIGSHHFVFEDEQCRVDPDYEEKLEALPKEYSCLYLAIENRLAAAICIEDPLRPESAEVIRKLKEAGIGRVVMMTGDSMHTAASVAAAVGADEFYAEVLPEDKADFVKREKAAGRTVIMIGDGINDSPALSAADAGIAVSGGAELARELADIMITEDNLWGLVMLKRLSDSLMKRIQKNYRLIIGINAGLIASGFLGFLAPGTSAFLHNASTLAISLRSMRKLLP